MKTNEMTERMAATEAEVLHWLGGAWDSDRLFWLRVELGQDWLRERFPQEADRKAVQDSAAWWRWWRQVWHINDRRWLALVTASERLGEVVPYHYFHDSEGGKYWVRPETIGVSLAGSRHTNQPAT